ncbi:MAG: hypothetical protein J0I46_06730 [Thiobacillus sp.]|uniref:hypothetical protein n=1 Tax=Thiobacillus sp. 0-1251 TaxID=1895858 RepID=UPI000ADCF65E|nr:hypothetical protein [Thiobacillus sp. 0-1251]MBN8771242.1 hypothetical protein [Thiobacillus sp.]
MQAPAHLYVGAQIALLTRHDKQRVIAPVLEGAHRETHPLSGPRHADPRRCDICNP